MSEQKYKSYRYYEGLCSTKDIIKELSKVLSIGVRSNQVKNADGSVLLDSFILQSKNWDVVYPAPDSTITVDATNMTADEYKIKILNQVSQISDTVILKTVTTPVTVDTSNVDDLAENSDALKESLTMYLQLYKPTYVANPEEYPLDCELQGVIPKVITKSMHKDALSVTKHIEEVVTLATNSVCKISETSTTKKDIVTYTVQAECSLIVSKIIAIYGENAATEGFYMPGIAGASTNNITLDKTKILEIKATDNDLYTLIRETLNVDDNEFQAFTTLTFNVTAESLSSFVLSIEAITKKQIYTVSGTYTLQNCKTSDVITTTVIPEYYIDGVYVSLDSDLWSYDLNVLNNRGIKFEIPISGDIAKNGHIVLRYDIKKESEENVSERTFMLNNHYMLVRVFDDINEAGNGPSETTYNDKGEVVIQRAHISDWTKLSWYKDFEEIYQDEIDSDVSTTMVADGTLLVPLETAGLNGETKIRYWLNTNNDRFDLIIMGNPSLDYERDRHIVSACYCGKIDSFDFSVNDTAGNFALFASSSTEPCKSSLSKEKTYYSIDYSGNDYSSAAFKSFLATATSVKCSSDTVEYYVQLPEGRYFNKSLWPKYIILDANAIPITDLQTVYQINYVENNQAVITIHQAYESNYSIYIGYPYYEEKIVLNSGVQRDIFGNVLSVDKTDTFGVNTSDGTTSVMMYHTQSKAYYQKHHMMFTTTEEYMSKVMYGKSMYTNEYYADRIKITHGNDGPRGMLNDMLVIDSSSLYPFDELVINKDFEKNADEYEETYVYFPVTAPFSPLSDSPNARYGLAIKKSEQEPDFTDEKKIVNIAIDELKLLSNESWWGINNNIYPLASTSNGSTVLWSAIPNSQWVNTETTPTTYAPIELALVSTEALKGDSLIPLVAELINESKVTSNSNVAYVGSKVESKIMFDTTGFVEDAAADTVYFGVIQSTPAINKDAVIKVKMTPQNNIGEYATNDYYYGVQGVPFCGKIETTGNIELILKNAKPTDKLIVYGVLDGDNSLIKNFAIYNLTQDLIKYPCEIKTSVVKGSGTLYTEPIETINYSSDYTAIIKPDTGWSIEKVVITDSDGTITTKLIADLTLDAGTGRYSIPLTNVVRNNNINISFVAN